MYKNYIKETLKKMKKMWAERNYEFFICITANIVTK